MMTNRTKGVFRKEAKASTKPQNVDYTPTAAEREIVARQHQRRLRQSPAAAVKVQHKPPGVAQIEPDHSDQLLWTTKVLASMGTVEWAFANKLLGELLNTACQGSNAKPLAQDDVNAAYAAMHGIAPKDELEAMLAAQMLATHFAAMNALRRLKTAENIPQQDSNGNLAVKLLRTYAAQLEALTRYRGKGQQTVRVEHVTVQAGGQAIVGAIAASAKPGEGVRNEIERQPHAIAYSPGETLPGAIEADRAAVPITRR